MEFKSIIKTHDLNPWQFIHPNPNSHWQYQNPILIGNIQAQFSLATSKTQFSLALLYQKEKSPRLSMLGKEKNIMLKCYCGKKRTMAIILWRNSLRAILRIMFSYYEPMKYVDIILHHDVHNIYLLHRGKTFKPTSSLSKLLETMNVAICNSSK